MAVGILIISSAASPSIVAANPAECGPVSNGKTLTFTNGVCIAEFSVAGQYFFNVPNGATELAAITVGGGSGGGILLGSYAAGDGGKVGYTDLSAEAFGTQLELEVGAGGPFENNLSVSVGEVNGHDTILSNSAQVLSTAGKGLQNLGNPAACEVSGSTFEYGTEGAGAGGDPVYGDGYLCSGLGGPGINPSVNTVDSEGAIRPAILSNYSMELGRGGFMALGTEPLALGPGQGGSAIFSPVDLSRIYTFNGSDGLVVFLWKPAAPAQTAAQVAPAQTNSQPTLVRTGNDLEAPGSWITSALVIAIGLALLLLVELRIRSQGYLYRINQLPSGVWRNFLSNSRRHN